MKVNNKSHKPPRRQSKNPTKKFLSKDNTIAIYTALVILRKMKSELGLEAMLDYIDLYLKMIDEHNPEFRNAVSKAMAIINVNKIYQDATNESS